ncbi:MAG: hypothetical protein U9O94_07020 [Nanoarchaeota archaeon]|nr:hypothetical protein [Nanoarchaeota archaeon]
MDKKQLITAIMQKCAVSMTYGLDDVFMRLIGLSESELKKIAHELYINTK